MQDIIQQEDIFLYILSSFSDPFDMIKVLSLNKKYSSYLMNHQFWIDLIKTRYHISYTGSNPRSEYIKLFFKIIHNDKTKFRDLSQEYHWIAYLKYFSGDGFPFNIHEYSNITSISYPSSTALPIDLGIFNDVDISTLFGCYDPLDVLIGRYTCLWFITTFNTL